MGGRGYKDVFMGLSNIHSGGNLAFTKCSLALGVQDLAFVPMA